MNVLLTRAQRGLIVIGNLDYMSKLPGSQWGRVVVEMKRLQDKGTAQVVQDLCEIVPHVPAWATTTTATRATTQAATARRPSQHQCERRQANIIKVL